MSFEVMAAIDLFGGRLAQFSHGEHLAVSEFNGDPEFAAAAFASAGAVWAHVVDMDLAFEGVARNLDTVTALARSGLRVQASGGVVSRSEVSGFLEAGAERVVIGSGALADRNRLERLVAEFGERVAVGLEVDGAYVAPRGLHTGLRFGLADVLGWLAGVPISRVVVTAVEAVGDMQGPDLKAVTTVRRAIVAPLLAAGGIATAAQVALLKDAGAEGVILGRALVEGSLDLAEVLALN